MQASDDLTGTTGGDVRNGETEDSEDEPATDTATRKARDGEVAAKDAWQEYNTAQRALHQVKALSVTYVDDLVTKYWSHVVLALEWQAFVT